jgi:hypothetical protein
VQRADHAFARGAEPLAAHRFDHDLGGDIALHHREAHGHFELFGLCDLVREVFHETA